MEKTSKIKLLEDGIVNDDIDDNILFDAKSLKNNLTINIKKLDNIDMECDIIGCDASLANSIRRILISENPSIAIEKVLLYNNTSVIPDEVLCHRLGLIPLDIDPRILEFKQKGTELEENSIDTLKFELAVKCVKNKTDASEPYLHDKVLSSDIKWIPIGNQSDHPTLSKKPPKPVESNILIAQLNPGQEISCTMLAYKGIGRDHAKFSPVCTAFYRLHPEIILKEPIINEDAHKLQKCFSKGVIEIVNDTNGNEVAQVKDARNDLCSRNVFRHPELKDKVELYKLPHHFIFYIESLGAIGPDVLFLESIKILQEKCQKWLNEIKKCEIH